MGVELLGAAEASLLEHYLDTVEHLPDDVQRTISLLREIDHQYQHVLSELEHMMCQEDTKKTLIQKTLIRAQELADEKLYHMQQLMDTIDNKSRQLEFDAKALDKLNRHHSPATTFSECLSKERFLERNQNSPLAAHSSDDNSNQNIPNNSNISSSLNNNSNNNNNGSNNSIGSNNSSSINNISATNNGGTNLTHSHNNNSLHSGNSLNSGADRGGQQHVGKHKEDNIQSSSGGHAGAKRARRAAAAKDYSESSYDKREKRTSTQQNAKGSKRGSSDAGQGKKRKSARQQDVISPVDAIDPDEPLYCLCHQVSYGEMICCDNEECSMEWFHFTCVSLNTKPKGKWYCPRCRGDRSNQMKKIS